MLKKNSEYETGVFKGEIKNRFRCLVEINGNDEICYIPSSCKLESLIDLNGKKVLLIPNDTHKSKTAYSVFAIKNKNDHIILNTAIANKLVANNIKCRRFSFLGKRNNVFTEKNIYGYKSDLYIADTDTIVEIKSIITDKSCAVFPTVHSLRAIQQLEKIYELLNDGHRVLYCFVSLNPYVKEISINTNDTLFYDLFKRCSESGMMTYGLCSTLQAGYPSIKSSVEIIKV